MAASYRPRVWLALATIYIVWGSTFMAVTIAVRDVPPLLAMGIRHVTAGAVLLAWALPRGDWKGDLQICTGYEDASGKHYQHVPRNEAVRWRLGIEFGDVGSGVETGQVTWFGKGERGWQKYPIGQAGRGCFCELGRLPGEADAVARGLIVDIGRRKADLHDGVVAGARTEYLSVCQNPPLA